MKQFVFDRLVDRENICNLDREQQALRDAIARAGGTVVYGPRNYGKTSVMRNVIIEDFKRTNKRAFVFFVDLLGVRDSQSLADRMSGSLSRSFAASFPVQGLLESATRFLGSLRPEVSLDPQTGSPAISLRTESAAPALALQTVWEHIARITGDLASLVVLDEFQDVAFVGDGAAQMRTGLEGLPRVPVIVMGSKRHMLSELFARADAPLAGWGTDLEFRPIPYDQYHAYIMERFRQRRLRVSPTVATSLQDDMQRVPEAINRLCFQIMEIYEAVEIGPTEVRTALLKLLENREGRYAAYLACFSATEEKILRAMARRGVADHPQSKSFLSEVGLASRTVGLAVKRLWDAGPLEHVSQGYRIADPLLAAYLRRYR
jgi:hypothetical protein